MTRVVAVLLLLGALASPAFAHALLRKATPGVGSTVHTPPASVSVVLSEGVEPTFSGIEVRDAAGARVDTGEVHTAPGDAKTLIVGLKPLAAGTYAVQWHVTSVDTHKTEGKFSFTVAP
jgi:methionine-rich copper-binding protein CopC